MDKFTLRGRLMVSQRSFSDYKYTFIYTKIWFYQTSW